MDTVHKAALAIWLTLVALTSGVIWLVYDEATFARWPWFRASMILSTWTCLWVFALWFPKIQKSSYEAWSPFPYAITILPFGFMLVYPGTKALGLHSDENIIMILVAIEVVHGIGYYALSRAISNMLQRETPTSD